MWVYLFRELKFRHNRIYVFLGESCRMGDAGFDEGLERSFQELIYFFIVVVVVSNAVDALQ